MVQPPKGLMTELGVTERERNFKEVELGYIREIACKEACRCLRCDAELQNREELDADHH